jgi:hypothetical protein
LRAKPETAKDGPLRHLTVEGERYEYAFGLPAASGPTVATIIFVDGNMKSAAPADYELYTR